MQTYTSTTTTNNNSGSKTKSSSMNTPRKEIIAIKKLNYNSPRVNLAYTNGCLLASSTSANNNNNNQTTNSSTAAPNNGATKSHSNSARKHSSQSNQASIDLDYLTRKLKQFQLVPSPSSPTLATMSSSNPSASSSTKKSPSSSSSSKNKQQFLYAELNMPKIPNSSRKHHQLHRCASKI